MDRKQNESSDRRREEILARRLAEALDQRGAATSGAGCPDANILAAYAEQALAPEESVQWENHFAGCARCRTILRVLTASADTPLAGKEVARLGALVATTRAPDHAAPANRPRRIDWRMRWLAPALGVAAAVAVLLILRPVLHSPRPASSEVLVAQAPKQELPLSPATPAEDRVARESVPQEKKAGSASVAKQEIEPRAQEEYAAPKEQRPNLPAAATVEPSDDRALAKAQANAAPIAPQPSPPPTVSSAADAGTEPSLAPGTPPSAAQTVTAAEAAPAIQQKNAAPAGTAQPRAATDLPLNGRNFQSLARLKAAPDGGILLKPPSGKASWRVGAGGSIQRSVDSGQTWTQQASPSNADWRSGTAVSATVCWIAGRQGTIARTLDGEHWEMVRSPAGSADAAGKLPDWSVVAARDAQSATVTATDGRSFATQDGGKTWQAR